VPDLRAAILARCDELARIADAAATREGGATWHACYRPNEAAWAWDVAASPDRPGYGIVDGRTKETAAHVATWDPAAALALVAGARGILAEHKTERGPRHPKTGFNLQGCCATCGPHDDMDWMGYPDFWEGIDQWAPVWPRTCPTLTALAKMIGVETDA
jgi:hypothetical protein